MSGCGGLLFGLEAHPAQSVALLVWMEAGRSLFAGSMPRGLVEDAALGTLTLFVAIEVEAAGCAEELDDFSVSGNIDRINV